MDKSMLVRFAAASGRFLALPVFDTKHTFYELCLPFVCRFGLCMDLADPVSSGKYSGRSCSQLQLRSSMWCRSQSLCLVGPSLPLQLS